VYKVGKKDGDHGASTDFDPTDKPITPMGGFVGYGEVREDYLIIKVCWATCQTCGFHSSQVPVHRLHVQLTHCCRSCGVLRIGSMQLLTHCRLLCRVHSSPCESVR
jgi:Ribosomal protein L3